MNTPDLNTVARHHPEDAAAQLHSEFTDIVRTEIGMNEFFASDIAAAFLRGLRKRFGCQDLYIPAEDRSVRNAAIKAEFRGGNIDAVCKKFGVSKATVYRIANE